MTSPGSSSAMIDTSRPHSARMYDYYLGGRDWYPADQKAAEQALEAFPAVREAARANRAFMHRATRVLASEYGIRQFVDIGTGIPTEPNLHQVAQRVAPESRVVYVDHDPLVLEYADVLMRSTPEGRTAFVLSDLRYDDVLSAPKLREVVDLDEPVAVSLVAILHFVTDESNPHEAVRDIIDRLAPGSALVLSHVTHDFDTEGWWRVVNVYRDSGTPAQVRTGSEIERFLDGLEPIDPGLTLTHRWRPEEPVTMSDADSALYAAVALKR
jgi:SAM-dependent methyltransferase